MLGTVYSHYLGFDKIIDILKKHYPTAEISVEEDKGSDIATVGFENGSSLRVQYRQRRIPSYQIPQVDDSPLTSNLKGLYGYVQSLPAKNEQIKNLFLQKILTLNSEFSIMQTGEVPDIKLLFQELASQFDAVIFAQPGTVISKSDSQHFLDNALNLIIDTQGNSEIDNLDVKIDSAYFDHEENEITQEQIDRKNKSEQILFQNKIKINKNLPVIESEEEAVFRTPKEIAQRVTVLSVTNLVAFNNLTGEDAIAYLKQYNLWEYVTPGEIEFLNNPTDERKNYETWKCEGIWTLLWALGVITDLGSPNELCNLNNIPQDKYPYPKISKKDPNEFINSVNSTRVKSEILDANDLYYRFDWACVDARINKQQITGVHYERHYALNWLVGYMGQEWDDVSCDT